MDSILPHKVIEIEIEFDLASRCRHVLLLDRCRGRSRHSPSAATLSAWSWACNRQELRLLSIMIAWVPNYP
jgi:hypothetical protein